ncbi:MAG: molybdate ABC transporter substrate-binding protein [Desulfomonile tiedjei]|nr:molybdate ABC transporter substrate-binding protein [Desulfomonile tiedjei]
MRINRSTAKWSVATAIAAAILFSGFLGSARAAEAVTVFAAASLTNAITDLGNMFAGKGAGNITSSFAASSALAKQIENGASANLFISADEEWMNYLSEKRLIVPESRFNLLGNRMVLIAPADANLKVDIKPGFPLAQLLGNSRLSTGDPDHVPVGKYAKRALEKLGVWTSVEGKLARADNARAALALVERGECPFGIVYATDAAISKKVKVVGTFPEVTHPPITYPAALVSGKNTPAARSFVEFLKTPDAKVVFEKFGFTVR